MKQDMIVILDLGSHENTVVARAIRALGVYSEIYPHDITAAELKALPNVKGIIINGGPNNVIDGVEIDVLPEIYEAGFPVIAAGHAKATCAVSLPQFENDEEAIKAAVKSFVFDTCKAEANWNMKNFVADQVELIRRQVGDKKVLLAFSGGVDSSVVAALLLKAIGENLVCVHVNHGLMRKGESENVIEVFKNGLDANLVYVDATDRFLDLLAGVSDPASKRKIIGAEFIKVFMTSSTAKDLDSEYNRMQWAGEEYLLDYAIFIQNHGKGISASAAQSSVVLSGEAFATIPGEKHIRLGIILRNVGRGGFFGNAGVDGDYRNGIAVLGGDGIKVRQFVDTGSAPSAPEVDNGDFAGFGGIDDLGG